MTPDQHDRQKLALDWVTIWQSEMSAAAADRERVEVWSAASAIWAACARAALAGAAARDRPAGPAAPAPPAGAAATADAPDARDHALARLAARVDELERRLAG